MGLAVSQVRLLALTTRKADIELQMQINSKRKQMLTRKSTELAQQYYSRLQNSNIQYATSNGYEDVTYNYLMGETANNMITNDFWSQIATGSDKGIAQKHESRMILTNQYGEVVVNSELAIAAAKAKDSYADKSVQTQTCQALLDLIKNNQNNQQLQALYNTLRTLSGGEATIMKVMELMLKNGGYIDGGTVYKNGTNYYKSPQAAKGNATEDDIVTLQAGVCYTVNDANAALIESSCLYDGTSFISEFRQTNAKYLGNLIQYFAPILSAAIQNGTTADIKKEVALNEVSVAAPTDLNKNDDQLRAYIDTKLTTAGKCCKIVYNGRTRYFQKTAAGTSEILARQYYSYSVEKDDAYVNANNGEKLQAGFKSGVFQLCMVTDPEKGIFHKNTTLDYFIHMQHVVEKTDSSEREEITAWFNAEQALISEQETYWDAEIQNLSTELNSVNTEIESVKTLKSNAIKSVFDWGGS